MSDVGMPSGAWLGAAPFGLLAVQIAVLAPHPWTGLAAASNAHAFTGLIATFPACALGLFSLAWLRRFPAWKGISLALMHGPVLVASYIFSGF